MCVCVCVCVCASLCVNEWLHAGMCVCVCAHVFKTWGVNFNFVNRLLLSVRCLVKQNTDMMKYQYCPSMQLYARFEFKCVGCRSVCVEGWRQVSGGENGRVRQIILHIYFISLFLNVASWASVSKANFHFYALYNQLIKVYLIHFPVLFKLVCSWTQQACKTRQTSEKQQKSANSKNM